MTDGPLIQAQFYHGHFGWLTLDRQFGTVEQAVAWIKDNPCETYRHRVRVIEGTKARVAWTDSPRRRS